MKPALILDLSNLVRGAEGADYDSLMRDGVALRRAGDDVAALKRFQEAYGINKTPRALGQIGLAEQALGRWATADKHLRQALESANDEWVHKNRASIKEALSVIAAHVGQLDVSGTPAGAEVRIDGEPVGQLPLMRPTTVTAGGVAVEVRAPGFLPIVRVATVSAGTLTRENFTLQPVSPTADKRLSSASSGAPKTRNRVDGETSPPSSSGQEGAAGDEADSSNTPADSPAATTQPPAAGKGRAALIIAASVLSVASLSFGVIEHLSWQRKVDSFRSLGGCGTSFPDRGAPGCKQLHDDGLRARLFAFVGYGVGAAFGVTALILFLTEPARDTEGGKLACATVMTTPGFTCGLRF